MVPNVSIELSALQALLLDQRTVPGPAEDLRPWLFELLTRWAAGLQSCRFDFTRLVHLCLEVPTLAASATWATLLASD